MNPHPMVMRLCVPVLAALLLAPAVALAHAELVESDPPDQGSVVTPHTMTATFSEPLDANQSRIVVRDAAGGEVARGGVLGAAPETMVVELPELAPGGYVARWTAVGVDGHVERGNIGFTVTESVATPSPTPTPTAAATGQPATPVPTPAVTPPPTATPGAAPGPSPALVDDEPTAGAMDLLIAVTVAALLLAGLLFFLWRRRAA